jgi:hypothetical protein
MLGGYLAGARVSLQVLANEADEGRKPRNRIDQTAFLFLLLHYTFFFLRPPSKKKNKKKLPFSLSSALLPGYSIANNPCLNKNPTC